MMATTLATTAIKNNRTNNANTCRIKMSSVCASALVVNNEMTMSIIKNNYSVAAAAESPRYTRHCSDIE